MFLIRFIFGKPEIILSRLQDRGINNMIHSFLVLFSLCICMKIPCMGSVNTLPGFRLPFFPYFGCPEYKKFLPRFIQNCFRCPYTPRPGDSNLVAEGAVPMNQILRLPYDEIPAPASSAAFQPFPASIRKSVAIMTYLPFSGLRRIKGSLTPFSPISDSSTGFPLFRSIQCRPSLLSAK